MSRRTIIAAAIAALAALLFMGTAHATTRPQRVVVVLAPYLTWGDVMSGAMPRTRALAEKGVVGDVNVKSGTVGSGAPTLSRGSLMLSAGAFALSDARALEGYSATETVEGTHARDLYRLVFARDAAGGRVLYVGSARQAAANARTSTDALVGALGQAMRDGGLMTAAIGNSDLGLDAEEPEHMRPAAIVAADERGLVDLGDVSTGLLAADAAAPFGVRTDQRALEAAYEKATQAGARFVVIDPGDATRAYELSSSSTSEAAAVSKVAALRCTDNVVGMVARTLTRDDLLVVVAPVVAVTDERPAGYAPLIMSGTLGGETGGSAGIASTPSTRRDGVCTVMDVTATLLAAAGLEQPPEVVGSPIRGVAAGDLAARVALLGRLDTTAVTVESMRIPALNIYITLTVIILLASAALVGDRGRLMPVWGKAVLRGLLVLTLAFAPAGLLMFAILPAPSGVLPGGIALVGTALAIWVAALLVARGRRPGVAVLAVAALTTLVLAVDQWIGAPLSYATVFGYSPLVGARYYGIGNEMAGALLGSSMVAAALVLDLYRDLPWVRAARRIGWPALGALVVVTTAAPFFGANVGAIAWMTVGFLISGLVLAGKRVMTWRNLAIALVLVLVLLAAAAAADLYGGSGGTHLSRAISGTGQSGPMAFFMIVARKAETNMRIFGRTNWTWLLLATLVVLGYMRWRPRGEFAVALRAYPAIGAAMAGLLAAGLVGYFTEDSGIIIPALALLPVCVAVLEVMFGAGGADGASGAGGPAGAEPGGGESG